MRSAETVGSSGAPADVAVEIAVASFSAAATRRDLVAGGLGLRLGDEQVDLGELGVEVRERRPPSARTSSGRLVAGVGGRDVGHRRAGRGAVVDQSSGIRIQPWRIA